MVSTMLERLSIKHTPPVQRISLRLYSLSREDTERKLSLNVGREGKNNTAESAELKHEQAEMIPQEVSDKEFEWGCWTGQEESGWETTEVIILQLQSVFSNSRGRKAAELCSCLGAKLSKNGLFPVLKHRRLHPLTWTYSEACSHGRAKLHVGSFR